MAEILIAVDADRQLVGAWVAKQVSPRTRSAYAYEGAQLLGYLAKPLRTVTASDLQAYVATLEGSAPATIGLVVSAVRSLFRYGRLSGVLANDPAATLSAPPIKNVLAERILDEASVRRLIDGEPDPRNLALLALFYGAGLRRAELCGLVWRDLAARGNDRGQATVFGKGGKTRVVLLYGRAWGFLQAIRGEAGPDDPVFRSRKGGHLDPSMVHRIVKAAAGGQGCRTACRRIGSGTRSRHTRSIVGRRCRWCSRALGMQVWRRRRNTFMPGQFADLRAG